MVSCDRCHHKFSSYAALSQHYRNRHPRAKTPSFLQRGLETEAASMYSFGCYVHNTSSKTKLVAFIAIIIIATSIIGVVAFRQNTTTPKTLTVGMAAPDFTLPDTAGGSFTLSHYRGRSNVLLFFNEGLSCAPCLQQMQALDQISSQLSSLNITAASITTDHMDQLQSWAMSDGPKQSVVMSDSTRTVSASYDMLGDSMHPGMAAAHTFVIVDKAGTLTWRKDYYPPSMYVSDNQLMSDIRQAMGA